jgi:hypothetical protein
MMWSRGFCLDTIARVMAERGMSEYLNLSMACILDSQTSPDFPYSIFGKLQKVQKRRRLN